MPESYVYSPETIIKAYSLGVFPMAESRLSSDIRFYDPDWRGIIPINPPHIPRRLLREVKKTTWQISINKDFRAVIENCAAETTARKETWINPDIKRLFLALHKMGFAHSLEVWDEGQLIGGLYGVCLGAVFFGESMFSRQSNASKIALCHLMARLYYAGFELLDAQFTNEHLRQFGLIEISRDEFHSRLKKALKKHSGLPLRISNQEIFAYFLQAKTVTS